ncbi:MAG TPA: hypothetical protein VLT62_14670 [Candidatus Methylomirabilis sp.]|nr:hypothetical protein [Candidatus Methylomirabilis sp.]
MATGTYSLLGRPRLDGIPARPVEAASRSLPRPLVDAGPAARSGPRPAWMLLYALLPLCAGLFALLDYVAVSGGLRTLAEGGVVILVIGLAAVWVRANRRTLSQLPFDPETESGPTDVRLEVHDPSPLVIHLGRTIHDRTREFSGPNDQ